MGSKEGVVFLWGLILSVTVSCSQPGSGPGPVDKTGGPLIYAGGYCTDSSGIQVPGYWKNGTWASLPTLGAHPAGVVSLVLSANDIYVGGWCWSGYSSTTLVSGYWKNGVWAGWGSQIITSLIVYGNSVYAGGYYWTQGGSYGQVRAPGYWKDGTWTSLPTQSIYGASVAAMVESGGHIYAGGYATVQTGSGPVVFSAYPGYWVDGIWNPLPNSGLGGQVESLVASGGSVYAGGVCDLPPSPMDPQTALAQAGYWLNGSWVGLTSTTSSANVSLIAISGSDIYAVGRLSSTLGYWKNGSWTALSQQQVSATSLFVDANDVYVGGSDNSSGVAKPGYWKNGTWNGLTPLDATKGGQVTTLAITR